MNQFKDTETTRTVGNALTEGNRQEKGDGYQWTFKELVARDHMTYIFLDRVFDTDNNLHGAVGTGMVPVTQEEFDRRLEEYKDYEYSPIAHIYHEEETEKSWDEWISEWEYDLHDMVLDPSHTYEYGDTVKEMYLNEEGIEAEYVECVSGGRMFRNSDYDKVYREDLLTLIEYAEENGLTEFF